ncbi:hypothetical protein [Rhizobium sp. TRM95796]|uniref:hypothetical protein n=2 Tax=unclassified Rhizobium TaxID=2613769 RepID=UPI0021E98F45|nr:hypothetical protein [Rhizobium sp. TRM95796]MCV3767080.1 hypothetical protein [Rhizobium sp. TRM95796]
MNVDQTGLYGFFSPPWWWLSCWSHCFRATISSIRKMRPRRSPPRTQSTKAPATRLEDANMLLKIRGFFKQFAAEIVGSQPLQEEGRREVMTDRLAERGIPPVDKQTEEVVHIERSPDARTDL